MLDALTVAGIEHTVGAGGRNIMVPAERLYEANDPGHRGLAAPSVQGNALLDQDAGLGASRRMETTRFRRALEGELAQSIESLAGVQKARVHLALPERSVFLRSQAETTASVVLTRVRGGNLSPAKSVASSVWWRPAYLSSLLTGWRFLIPPVRCCRRT